MQKSPYMILAVLPVGMLECNCCILGDQATKTALVIDPGDDIDEILSIIAEHQVKVVGIVITHAHIDHIGGAAKLKAATQAPVYMNSRDQVLYDKLEIQAEWLRMAVPDRTDIDSQLKDGDRLILGDREIHVLHTPGHTQGSSCLYLGSEQLLIAGDTLFRDSIGRTDLPGGDGKQILSSIKTKLLTLPEDTEVICGHGRNTTIGRERDRNPFLKSL